MKNYIEKYSEIDCYLPRYDFINIKKWEGSVDA